MNSHLYLCLKIFSYLFNLRRKIINKHIYYKVVLIYNNKIKIRKTVCTSIQINNRIKNVGN
jgi:hypothetical protein